MRNKRKTALVAIASALMMSATNTAHADLLGGALGAVGDVVDGVTDTVEDTVDSASDTVEDVVDGVTGTAGSAVNGVVGTAGTAVGGLLGTVTGPAQASTALLGAGSAPAPVTSFDETRATAAARSQFPCSAGGNSSAYNGQPVVGRSGTLLGIVNDAIVDPQLRVTRIRFLSNAAITGSPICVEYGGNRIRSQANQLRLPIAAFELAGATSH